jgi:RNA polymerase sigma-70 factor (ECF subfamily)
MRPLVRLVTYSEGGVERDDPRESELRARVDAGRTAWPQLALDPGVFERFLSERAVDGELPRVELAPDLFLACACAHGVRGAAEALEEAFGDVIRRVMERRDRAGMLLDDARQALRARLFVGSGDGALPKIADYAGRAPLRSWLAAAASRTVIDLRRRAAAKREDPASGIRSLAADLQPELEYIKTRYRGEFHDAVRAAVARLTERDRALLKLNLSEGMSVDRLGALYGVGRSTAARWLAAARRALLEETRQELCARLRITPSEYESLAALVRSDLELSVGSLLGG